MSGSSKPSVPPAHAGWRPRVAYPEIAARVMHPAPPADGFEEVGQGRRLHADVVVVGSGPGGAAAAWVLAESGAKVVVVEEGPPHSRFRKNQAHTQRFHMQEGGTMVSRGNAYIPIAAGRGVGGGTLINSALCFRTPEHVLRDWVETLNDDAWSHAALTPVYDELSEIIGVGITPEYIAGENNKLIARGVDVLGYRGGLAPRNTPGCIGCGVCNYGCPANGKASTNLTFLPRAVAAGARIQADTKITEILVERGRAVGVRGLARNPDTNEAGGMVEVRADRVVLACGGIGTPRLLWQAGIARELGPATGEGLHIHPGNAVLGICDQPIELWKGATQGAFFHHPDLPGVLPHAFTAPPEACLVALGLVGPRLEEGLKLLPHLAGLIVMVSDEGTGRVRATADGRADISYDFLDSDLDRIKRGLVEAGRVLLAGGAKELLTPVRGVGRHKTPESLAKALADRTVQDFPLYAAHPMSTCRMGLDPDKSVIGPTGEAHRMPGLFITDSSVFPTSLGVNPQLTTMAVATVLARRMAAVG